MTRIALIVGGGLGMWREWRVAVDMVAAAGAQAVYIAVNGAGIEHPDPLHHWASQHIDHLYERPYEWAARREANGMESDYTRWSCSRGGNVDRWVKNWKGGSSGLLALDVALNGVGCDGAILCGIPMDERPNPYNRKSEDGWGDYERFRWSWKRDLPEFGHRTRSMSGWTKELLGAPTPAWILNLPELGAKDEARKVVHAGP